MLERLDVILGGCVRKSTQNIIIIIIIIIINITAHFKLRPDSGATTQEMHNSRQHTLRVYD